MMAWPRWVISAATVSRLLVVKKAWYRHRSNSPSWPFGLSSGMRRDHEPARHLLCLRSRREGDVGNLGHLGPRHPAAAALVIDGVPVGDRGPGILGDAADHGLDP